MKSMSIAVFALSLGILVSCKNENKEANPTESNVETQENPKTTAAVNPEHGQPGHDCSVPVGAPLNSQSSSGEPDQVNSDTAVNPPHGEPGHDCTVPVGAPLNSRTTTSNPSSSNVSPIRVNKSPEVNPPHGEPGHDCTAPVGAPVDN